MPFGQQARKGASLFDAGEAVLKKTVYPDLTHIADVLKSQYSSAEVAVVNQKKNKPIFNIEFINK